MISEVLEQGRLEIMLEMVTAFYEQHGEYMSVLLSTGGDLEFLQKIKDTLRPKILSIFQVSGNDARATLIFEFYISAALAFLTSWYRNGKPIPTQKAVALIYALVWEGIASVMFRLATKAPGEDDNSLMRLT